MSITKFPFSYVLFGIAAVKVMRFSQEHNTMTGQTPLLRHIQSFMPLSMLVCKMAEKHWRLTMLDGKGERISNTLFGRGVLRLKVQGCSTGSPKSSCVSQILQPVNLPLLICFVVVMYVTL